MSGPVLPPSGSPTPSDNSSARPSQLPRELREGSRKVRAAADDAFPQPDATQRSSKSDGPRATASSSTPTHSASAGPRISRVATEAGVTPLRLSSDTDGSSSEADALAEAYTPRRDLAVPDAVSQRISASSFNLPPEGTMRGFSTTKKLSPQMISYHQARFLGEGGSSKVYSVIAGGQEKILLVNTTPIGLFAHTQNLQPVVAPLVKTYERFRSFLIGDIVQIETIGSVPDSSDSSFVRLSILMEKLDSFTADLPHEQKIAYARKMLKMQATMKKQGLLHRDIKLENLLLRKGSLVWIDFLDTGTTVKQIQSIKTPKELRDYLGDRLAVSKLYSHPSYHELSEAFNRERLSSDEKQLLSSNKKEYIERELANQDVSFAITLWSLFLGTIPSPEGSDYPDLAEMGRQWDNVANVPSEVKEFVKEKLSAPFLGTK